jgi:hypothetical protein
VSSGCGACHDGVAAPKRMAWIKDWYAGRKDARYAELSGRADSEIARCELALSRSPSDAATKLMLAYLYEQRGAAGRAATMWTTLERTARTSRR